MFENIRFFILNAIAENKKINSVLNLKDKIKLTDYIKSLPDDKLIKLFKNLYESDLHLDRKLDKTMIGVSILAPGGIGIYGVYKLIRHFNYSCMLRCKNDKNKNYCYKLCDIKSIELAIKEVKKEMNDCWFHNNPEKCRKKSISYLKILYDRLEKAKIRLITYKEKNAKL